MQKAKTKKLKLFLLSVITGLMVITTGFFAYTAIDMFSVLHAKTSGQVYSLKQSGMVFVNGNNGIKLVYPAFSNGLNSLSFYFVFAVALLLSIGLITFMFVYFYRLIETQADTESALRSLEKNVLEIPSTIMHEIKGNINSVLINSRVLTEKIKNLEFNKEGVVKTGSLIESETARLAQTMDGILKFTKDFDINPEAVNLSAIIDETYEMLKDRLSSKGINFSISVDKNIYIKMDRDLMIQVFKNLILNAAESYDGKKGDILIYSSYILNKISLTVEDHGSGIEKETLKKIFEPFFTTKKTGAGLGLALTKRIVDAHRFNINIESNKGLGTKISMVMKDLQ
ncbi:MAG: sensor histidine kinase [bacterium]